MVSTKQLLFVLAVLLVIVGIAYGAAPETRIARLYPEAATIGQSPVTFDNLLKRFGDLAEEKGAEYAFDVLREAPMPPDTDIHLLAHEIGHQLYLQQGIDGMSVCTQEFRNGCSHSLVIEALQEFGDGDDVRKLIDDACKRAPGGTNAYSMCYHGLGHGVFAYYQYSLPETVAFCNKMGTATHRFAQFEECVGGAIMELVGGGGHDRELWMKANGTYYSPTNPLAPCDADLIPAAAKPRCYVYMSPHLMAYAGANMEQFNSDQLIRGMSSCTALPFGADRSACIGGFGKDFAGIVGSHDVRKLDEGAYSDDQLQEVESLCKHMSDYRDIHVCESYALSTFFWGGDAEPTISVRFCSILSDDASKDFCFTNLADNIARFISGDRERRSRCNALPEQYRDQCVKS